ncbi:MAG: ATP-grasp domain-containing protein [Caldilineae bacterium]|nr:ATP-grasp domain-containing protein [Chloroflexota bacterium]MCB9176781.1 ATP-grasp domain-containing protein [Caldilineae bacterium]
MSPIKPIRTLLVANRGEIARRVFRACHSLGITSAAVYGEVDAGSAWSRSADLSVPLGGVTAAETYLRPDKILAAARAVNADAIHPGYGFLSENADFAEACASAGITFVGPTPDAMRALGSKVGARAAAAAAGVPVIPGIDGAGKSPAELRAAAEGIGFPVLIKASAGGGGRGMRVVERAADFEDAAQAARAEAASAFGDDHLLVERYFPDSRHVEVQVLGDRHGKVIHLFERECSIQRRHQKIIEESPSPNIDADQRRAMTEAAVALAQQVGYQSAGTVEFLVDLDGNFYLLEMNTRLQVEHPVTEMVTGADLVAWQILVAEGRPLPVEQTDLVQRGHAIECRVYAEDPAAGFLPSIGRLARYRRPAGPGVRCDDGVASGSEISSHFDAMIAKVITQGWDRPAALRRMRQALAGTVALGLTTNIPYLQAILETEAFAAGATTTRFLERHMADWRPAPEPSDELWLAMAAFESLRAGRDSAEAGEDGRHWEADPWASTEAWRNLR